MWRRMGRAYRPLFPWRVPAWEKWGLFFRFAGALLSLRGASTFASRGPHFRFGWGGPYSRAMRDALIVGAGGFIGAILRHSVARALAGVTVFGAAFPLATLLVNVVGSFAMGAGVGLVAAGHIPETHRHLWMTGLLGALTTFSTFSVETIGLLRGGQMLAALGSVFLNVVLALLAARAGLAITS